jgi:hypothetical protein
LVYVQPKADDTLLMLGKVTVLAEMWVELEKTLETMRL